MVQSAIQLYTLRDLETTLPETLKRVANEGFEGIEFAYRIRESDVRLVCETLDETNLSVVGAHVPFEHLQDDFEQTISFYEPLNCSRIIIPQLGEAYFDSVAAVDEGAAILSTLAKQLDKHEYDLLYHNHTHEFGDLDGKTAFERLIDETSDEVEFELDAGLAAKGGGDPIDILRSSASRIPIVHLTDTLLDDPAYDHVKHGTGDIDLARVVSASHEADVEWLVFEHGQSDNQARTLRRGADSLRSLLAESNG